LLALPGVEVHGGRTEGKLIVTVEDVGRSEVADTLASINGVAGVINAILIYHYGGDDLAGEVDWVTTLVSENHEVREPAHKRSLPSVRDDNFARTRVIRSFSSFLPAGNA